MPDVVMGQPLSRTEAILQNMLGANNVLEPPMSREEYLLLQLLNHIGPSGDYYTKEEIDNMISALEQEIDWKESVATFADLATTYPDAEAGWTASVLADGRIYRYNGTAWIDIYGMIPLATSSVNGLMSSGKVIDLETIKTLLNGHSVASDVPANAVFTDTVYDDTALSGRVTVVEGLLDSHSVASDVPANAVFTDTVYDDTALSGRVSVVEGLLDSHSVGKDVPSDAKFTDTVYDDTELSNRVTELENDTVSKTVTGNPISITDAADAPIVSGEVTFEPKQDLHGYDKPWAGGAGKNKLANNLISGTVDGVTYTKQNDESININGTSTGRAAREIATISLPNGNYIISKGTSNGLFGVTVEAYNDNTWVKLLTNSFSIDDASFTVDNDGYNNIKVNIATESGRTANNIVFYPMIRLATETDPTFEPYSNECPIEGYADCEVEVTGKNLIYGIGGDRTNNGISFTTVDGVVTANGTATATAWYMSLDYATYNNAVPVKAGTYTISGHISGVRLTVYEVLSDDTKINITDTNISPTFTLDHDAHLIYNIRVNSGLTINHTFEIQLERGTEATSYAPYQSTTYTIDLDGTRYGGKVNLMTGVCRLTKVNITLDGSNDESWNITPSEHVAYIELSPAAKYTQTPISNLFNGISNAPYQDLNFEEFAFPTNTNYKDYINIKSNVITNESDLASWRTWLSNNNLQVCYELATPFTVQLTPEQIRTLEGTNNISTNMTDMSLEYITESYQPLVDLAEEERETNYISGGMFVDTSNVIVPLTAFTSEMSYTATEDCFAFLYLVTYDANHSPEVRIDDQLAYTNYYGNTIVGNSCLLPLKKDQTLTVAGINQTVESQYCVYGVTYINKIIQPVIYSENEREIGVWTDGKPLYQKTFDIGALTEDSSFHNVAHNISSIDKVIFISGTAHESNGSAHPLSDYRAGSSYGITVGANLTNIFYSNNWLTVIDCTVTLCYTKTTDTPGSGTWTPSGVPAVHYSTDEHVVGTWIDGSTIYEKTQSGGINFTQGDTWYDTLITGVDEVIEVKGSILRSGEPIELGAFTNEVIARWILRDNTIKLSITSIPVDDTFVLNNVTVKYTKTTD